MQLDLSSNLAAAAERDKYRQDVIKKKEGGHKRESYFFVLRVELKAANDTKRRKF